LVRPTLLGHESRVHLLRARLPVSLLVLKQHDLVRLELTICLLDFLFCILISIADILVSVINFVIEEFGELYSSLIKNCLVLVDTNDMWHPSFDEDPSDLL